LARYV